VNALSLLASPMIRAIRTKFTLWYIGSFFGLSVVSWGIAELLFQEFALQSIDRSLKNGAKQVIAALPTCFRADVPPPAEPLHDCFDQRIRALFPTDPLLAQLLEKTLTGEIVNRAQTFSLHDETLPLSASARQAVAQENPVVETIQTTNFGELRLLTISFHPTLEQTYILQFGVMTGESKHAGALTNPLTLRPHIFMLTLPLMLLLTSMLGDLFMKKAFAPIHQIVAAARAITAEDLSHRLPAVNSRDEIGELADAFNEMIARLERSFQQIQQFSGDVAHELKTPLTALRGEIEVALRKERAPAEYQEILRSLFDDTERLTTLVEGLLFLARMDARSLAFSFTPVALDELLLDVYEQTSCAAAEKQVTLKLTTLETVTVNGDANLLHRALQNLLTNAIKYTPTGGSIDVLLRNNGEAAVFTIADTGIGIPAAALPFIFDRFYRVDQSRAQATGGAGLGLAIVQNIVALHGGKIEVNSQEGRGTTFRVALPVNQTVGAEC